MFFLLMVFIGCVFRCREVILVCRQLVVGLVIMILLFRCRLFDCNLNLFILILLKYLIFVFRKIFCFLAIEFGVFVYLFIFCFRQQLFQKFWLQICFRCFIYVFIFVLLKVLFCIVFSVFWQQWVILYMYFGLLLWLFILKMFILVFVSLLRKLMVFRFLGDMMYLLLISSLCFFLFFMVYVWWQFCLQVFWLVEELWVCRLR